MSYNVPYSVTELRHQTHKYAEDPHARIPCPDCSGRSKLNLDEDCPIVMAIPTYCPLCDGLGFVTKARALAVLPCISEHIKKLKKKNSV